VNCKLRYEFLKRPDFQKFKQQALYEKLRSKVKNIAIYKGGGGLGDLVVGMGFFQAWRNAFPDANIKYMGTIYPRFQKIFDSVTSLDGYIDFQRPDQGKTLKLKQFLEAKEELNGKIDLLIDTQRRWQTSFWLKMLRPKYMLSSSPMLSDWKMPLLNYKKMHILEQLMILPARLGVRGIDNLHSRINIACEYKQNVQRVLKEKGPFVALMPSCGMSFKNWLPEYFAKLGDLFANIGYTTIILGSPKELELFESISGKMHHKPIIPAKIDRSLSEELMNDAAILELCDAAIGNDSGGMHLASCLGILSVTIFGPTTPRKFSPVGPSNIVLYNKLSCSPCRFKCSRAVDRECLVNIKPEEVFKKCSKYLNLQRKDKRSL